MLNPEFLNNDVDHSFLETVEDNTGEFEQGMNKEQQNICGDTDASSVMNKKMNPTLWSLEWGYQNALPPQWPRSTLKQQTVKTSANVTSRFVDQTSSRMIQPVIFFARMFPHLFFLLGVATQRSTEKFPYPYLNVWQTTQ
ncbi:hypothetical protein GQ600_10952 [Phytophthora cactorum]|nr:hypothetical protein GQ600_10952 [Phytophthora cactorum]